MRRRTAPSRTQSMLPLAPEAAKPPPVEGSKALLQALADLLLAALAGELGSARQVFLWAREASLRLPVVVRNLAACRLQWQPPAYHTVLQVLQNPIYPGGHAFGRARPPS